MTYPPQHETAANSASDPERVLNALRLMPPDQFVEPGVTAADALAVMTAPPVPVGCDFRREVVYGHAGRPLSMQLYARGDSSERCPGVVFIHGGGFIEGFPEMMIRYAGLLAGRGYVTASINYRLAGEALWPAALEDSKCAMRWMRAHAAELGLDGERLGVAGASAGGHLAAMVGSTPGQFEGTGGQAEASSAAVAVVLWYPGIDLRPSGASPALREVTTAFFGRPVDDAQASVASPLTYAGTAPPTLTFTGTADPIIPIAQVREYHRALGAAAIDNQLVEVADVGHSFDYNLTRWQECFDAMARWFDHHLAETNP